MAVDIEEEKRLIKEALYNIEVKAEVPGMTDVYTTEEEAQARAEELGGSGTHQHTFDGEEVYMPFDTHAEYETAIAEIKNKEISDRLNAALEKKTNDHNEEVGDDDSKRTTVGTLYLSLIHISEPTRPY